MEPSSDIDWHAIRPRSRGRWRGAYERLAARRRVPRFAFLDDLLMRFSPGERLALYGLAIALGISTLALVASINALASIEAPAQGGSLVEGEITPARFVNPVLAVSQADQDISALVYSGLMRALPDGSFVPDLAERYTISENGAVYTFTLRAGAAFHDGAPVTAEDVLYTVSLAQNPDVKSPRRADWEGVRVSTPDARTIVFTLPHAYAPFIENATLGILPKHAWAKTGASELPFNALNTRPIGTGPFRIASVDTDDTGAVTRYVLAPFSRFALGMPHLSRVTFLFFPNDEALIRAYNARKADAIAGISAAKLPLLKREDASLVAAPLPRVFGIFFNQGKNEALADPAVRAALDAGLDKASLIAETLGGFGAPLDGPIPPGILDNSVPTFPEPFSAASATPDAPQTDRANTVRSILAKGGWSWNEKTNPPTGGWTKKKKVLSIKLATADSPELVATAQRVAAAWRLAGIRVSVQVYPLSEFNNSILRPREYESILFGEVVGRDADLFAFWHSSQRSDPGLNLALYANSKADALLSQGRSASVSRTRTKLYGQFAQIVAKDKPAVFLYSPTFLYILPSELRGVRVGTITTPSERFLNVYQWYIETQRVWEFFAS